MATAMVKPTQDGSTEPEDAITDLFERCPALLKLMQKLLADASSLPWIPPPKMHVLTAGATSTEGPSSPSTNPATAPETPDLLSVRSCNFSTAQS